MADARTIEETVLGPMRALYGQPKQVISVAEAMANYILVLKAFSPQALHDGWTRTVAAHKLMGQWPSPGEIVAHCRSSLDQRSEAKRSEAARRPADPTYRHEAAADSAMLTTIGRQAMAEGWSRELWRQVATVGDLAAVDVVLIRQRRAEIDDTIRGWQLALAAGTLEGLTVSLLGFGLAMRRVEAEHAARFGFAAEDRAA